MEIQEIKQRLSIETVLNHYGTASQQKPHAQVPLP